MLPLDRRLTDAELREALATWLLNDDSSLPSLSVGDGGLEMLFRVNLGQRQSVGPEDAQKFYTQDRAGFDLRAAEIINDWQNQNIVMPDPRSNNPHHYLLTSYGRALLSADEKIELDPGGIIARLQQDVPTLDSLTLESFKEAMSCFRNGELRAAAVMLGVAAENAIRLLADALYDAVPLMVPGTQANKKLRQENLLTIKTTVIDVIKTHSLKTVLPAELAKHGHTCLDDEIILFKDFEETMDSLFAPYRRHRNESGHPTHVDADREMLKSHLLNFRRYARVTFGIKNLLEKL